MCCTKYTDDWVWEFQVEPIRMFSQYSSVNTVYIYLTILKNSIFLMQLFGPQSLQNIHVSG